MTVPEMEPGLDISTLSGREARELIRQGWRRPTTGMAEGWVQANLVVLPAASATEFLQFCQRNPQPCPLLEVTAPGSPEPGRLAPGADLRVDIGRYRVYRNGRMTEEPDDLMPYWREDLVAFLLGCSFTFEAALLRAGIPLRHIALGQNVPMYRTNRPCEPAGAFHGPLVVSMRPLPRDLVARATEITAQFPAAHGAPIHAGDAGELGIADLSRPDYGDAVPVLPGEVPVFWACGVTPQAAAEAAGIELMLTHAPGHMFVTDVRERDLDRIALTPGPTTPSWPGEPPLP